MSGHWLAAAAAACAAAVAVYWAVRFFYALPLERQLGRERRRALDTAAFIQELLAPRAWPSTPQMLSDALGGGVDRFLARFGRVPLAVWLRSSAPERPEGFEESLIVRAGGLADLEPARLALTSKEWDSAFEGASEAPPALAAALQGAGLPRSRVLPWGTPGRVWGLLIAADADPAGERLAETAAALEAMAAYFTAASEKAALLAELDAARRQLEGGLDQAAKRLDETNLQLIQRAKEMRTLKEVARTISGKPDRNDALAAIVTIVAKALEADLCAFLLHDPASDELVTQPGAYGISDDEGSLYRIALSNPMSSSVRVFKNGRAFLTGDAQNDPNVIAHFAKLWRCHSLMVVPLKSEGRTIGILRVGSFKRDSFTTDHMRFVEVIAEEAAVLVESAMLNRRLAETNRQLAELHRMKDDFISTVSHEFKTPLTSIKGFLSVVLDGEAGGLSVEQKRFLGIVKSASDRLAALVSDLLDLSRLEAGLRMDMASVRMDELARACVEARQFEAQAKGVSLSCEAAPGLPAARGDAQWLGQVLDNLVSNAVKFTPEGGSVSVSVGGQGNFLAVRVSDTGIGIAEGDLARVFDKFYRGANASSGKTPGTGLGLSICKAIVDRHGGRIWAESEAGKGSSFWVLIPAVEVAQEVEKAQ